MFTEFLYTLRKYGMKTGLNEWMNLMEALSMGLNEPGLTDFYHLARTILVKRVSDYDRFDQAFAECFKDIADADGLTRELLEWLSRTMACVAPNQEEADALWSGLTIGEIRRRMEERLAEQKEEHHGGDKWVGTGGITAFGHSGYAPKGIRVQGAGQGRGALKTAKERKYRDFREDQVLQLRQFQTALRRLRLLSTLGDEAKTELDVEKTIEKTCAHGGRLQLVLERPRRNRTKLLLLMDSGGSMGAHAQLCSQLFHAVNQGSRFKDLKIYYFHNCFYDQLFTAPQCLWEQRVSTEWVMRSLNRDYKVIVVGDAVMAPEELLEAGGSQDYEHENERPGVEWLAALNKRFDSVIWLNPLHEKLWDYDAGSRTIGIVRRYFPMFPLTVQGLEEGIRSLQGLERA